MIPDLDIYRTANILVKQHGEDAPIQAAMRADELPEKGDVDGYAVFKRVVKATEELLSKERPDRGGDNRTAPKDHGSKWSRTVGTGGRQQIVATSLS